MDHQVQHHGDIRTPCFERSHARRFDTERASSVGAERAVSGRESLQMSNLQHPLPAPGAVDQIVCFGQRRRDRLFHQHVLAVIECLRRERMVRRRGNRHDHRIRAAEQGGVIEGGGTRFLRERAGTGRVMVVYAGQDHARALRQFERVVTAEVASPDHADAKTLGHARGSDPLPVMGQPGLRGRASSDTTPPVSLKAPEDRSWEKRSAG